MCLPYLVVNQDTSTPFVVPLRRPVLNTQYNINKGSTTFLSCYHYYSVKVLCLEVTLVQESEFYYDVL